MKLNDRQQQQYDLQEKLAEKLGKFDQSAGADGAHYASSEENPFAAEGIVCSNCVYWVGPNGCEIVEGNIEPNAICKLWIIPEAKLAAPEDAALPAPDEAMEMGVENDGI
jgi:hypothetical protein